MKKTFYYFKFCFVYIVILLNALCAFSRDYKPEDIVNPNIEDRREYIADPGNLVDSHTKDIVNHRLYNLRLSTGAEVVVAVVPSIGDIPIEDFSEKIFTSWGIGKSDKDNGVLIVIVPEQRTARITTGYGVEGVIPDITARKIIANDIVPAMKEGNVAMAIDASSESISKILSDPTVAEELKSNNKEIWENEMQGNVNFDDFIAFVLWVVFLFFVVSVFFFIYDTSRLKNKDRLIQAQEWHNRRSTYLILAVASAGLGLIPFFLAERKRKKSREQPLDCPNCHEKMYKLNEEDDNSYLNPAQDLEERLNTVDYDVWLCPKCGTVERYAFKSNQQHYSECPVCHTIAMGLVRDHTLIPATFTKDGVGEKIYECQYCRNRKNERYSIPKKQNNAAMAAAAGSLLGGRGGNPGGGFGGGFGGGRTGGGGASGRW